MKKPTKKLKSHVFQTSRIVFWFVFGAVLGFFFFLSFVFIFYKQAYEGEVYPGITVNGVDFSGKKKEEVNSYFADQNKAFEKTTFAITHDEEIVNVTAEELSFGYDADLLSEQAYSLGRSESILSNVYWIFIAYISGIELPASFTFDKETLKTRITPLAEAINKEPVDAKFSMENGRVTEFKAHSDGEVLDEVALEKQLTDKLPLMLSLKRPTTITVDVPIKIIEPKVTVDNVNDMGITELIGRGTSLYQGSIPNRAYNIGHAANKITGVLVKPGEEFSFVKTVGDISSLTGYKQAYIISGGRTILGDGGGVCQVSTTLFRAILDAGLPITERNPHAYRVSYYEQDSKPGLDAAVYVPTVDLKFKNDTDHHILIQAIVDPVNQSLAFELYGTGDGREVVITEPVILSQSPAPAPLYQDDPELPKGTVKQIDWAAPGAQVYFTRTVTKDGKVLHEDKFASNYRPWQAVYLNGTKE